MMFDNSLLSKLALATALSTLTSSVSFAAMKAIDDEELSTFTGEGLAISIENAHVGSTTPATDNLGRGYNYAGAGVDAVQPMHPSEGLTLEVVSDDNTGGFKFSDIELGLAHDGFGRPKLSDPSDLYDPNDTDNTFRVGSVVLDDPISVNVEKVFSTNADGKVESTDVLSVVLPGRQEYKGVKYKGPDRLPVSQLKDTADPYSGSTYSTGGDPAQMGVNDKGEVWKFPDDPHLNAGIEPDAERNATKGFDVQFDVQTWAPDYPQDPNGLNGSEATGGCHESEDPCYHRQGTLRAKNIRFGRGEKGQTKVRVAPGAYGKMDYSNDGKTQGHLDKKHAMKGYDKEGLTYEVQLSHVKIDDVRFSRSRPLDSMAWAAEPEFVQDEYLTGDGSGLGGDSVKDSENYKQREFWLTDLEIRDLEIGHIASGHGLSMSFHESATDGRYLELFQPYRDDPDALKGRISFGTPHQNGACCGTSVIDGIQIKYLEVRMALD